MHLESILSQHIMRQYLHLFGALRVLSDQGIKGTFWHVDPRNGLLSLLRLYLFRICDSPTINLILFRSLFDPRLTRTSLLEPILIQVWPLRLLQFFRTLSGLRIVTQNKLRMHVQSKEEIPSAVHPSPAQHAAVPAPFSQF